jgi:dTDP-glucose 4,6-dehydratase
MGRPVELHGGGRAVKSFIHIRDVSRGERAILDRGRPGAIYHLSPDEGGLPVRDVVGLVCARLGTTLEEATREVGERPGQDAAYVIDSSRARHELDWSPQVGLATGIGEVVDWIEASWEEVKAAPLEYLHRP